MSNTVSLSFTLNGEQKSIDVPSSVTLGDLLRGDFNLSGTNLSCERGVCGACTVLLDGTARLSCITLAMEAQQSCVTTVEGLATQDPQPVQTAFDEKVAAQCGYCTPGFVVALSALFDANPDATHEEIRTCLGSNICRCTGYTKILAAAILAQQRMQAMK